MQAFASQSHMRRLLLGLMAQNLTGSEANRLLSEFYLMDSDSSGTIELDELVEAAKKVGQEGGGDGWQC
jgi:calcium-dependent protein kinase